MNKRRPGRPRGASSARADLLAVARRRFLDEGYAAVTLRSIAAEAGTDPALIAYHFTSKAGLFGASLDLPANPPQVLSTVLEGPAVTFPERLLAAVLQVWDQGGRERGLLRLAEAAVVDPEVGRLFREMAERELVSRLATELGGRSATGRASAASVVLTGLIFSRYLLRLEPIASASPDELIRWLAPPLRTALGLPAPTTVTSCG